MVDELRTCHRTGCRWPAAASLSFRYASRQAWLLDLAPEQDPSLYDLCPHHADTLRVPKGWERVDERSPSTARPEPAGRDLVRGSAEPTHGREQPARVEAGAARASRYEPLRQQLPRLAAVWARVGELTSQAADEQATGAEEASQGGAHPAGGEKGGALPAEGEEGGAPPAEGEEGGAPPSDAGGHDTALPGLGADGEEPSTST